MRKKDLHIVIFQEEDKALEKLAKEELRSKSQLASLAIRLYLEGKKKI